MIATAGEAMNAARIAASSTDPVPFAATGNRKATNSVTTGTVPKKIAAQTGVRKRHAVTAKSNRTAQTEWSILRMMKRAILDF